MKRFLVSPFVYRLNAENKIPQLYIAVGHFTEYKYRESNPGSLFLASFCKQLVCSKSILWTVYCGNRKKYCGSLLLMQGERIRNINCGDFEERDLVVEPHKS